MRPAEGAARAVGEIISADLLDGLAIGFFRSTGDGRIPAANRAFREIFGFPDDRTLLGGAAVSLYADPDDRRRAVLQLERDGTIHGFEARLRRFDGSLFWGKFSSRVLRDSAGR